MSINPEVRLVTQLSGEATEVTGRPARALSPTVLRPLRRSWALRPTLLAVDLIALVAGAALLEIPFDPLGVLAVAVSLVVFRHVDLGRWRSPSVVIGGLLLSAAATWLILRLATAAGIDAPLAAYPLLLLAAPLPGYLAAATATRSLPREPLFIEGTGPRAGLAARALDRTPLCPYRLSLEDRPGIARAPLPDGSWCDRDLALMTPLGALPLYPEGPLSGMAVLVKRSMDLLIALPALILTLPMTALFALLTRLGSPGPALYSQTRVTDGGRTFQILKLRSMVVEAEADGRPVWPEEDDPRITPLGRFMRRFWIDELPQLWNVLRGDLSLVGPRPERPPFIKAFSESLPKYPLRHRVPAGMTGLAQVMGFTGNTSLARRLHCDLRYVRAWSPWLDLRILFLTIVRIFERSRT